MDIQNNEIDERIRLFKNVCRSKGIKLTHQRLEIFKEIALTKDHPDAENLYKRVRQRMPTVSQDTVYRTLWLLKDLRLINTLGSPRERTRFDANLKQHHHFVCKQCGYTRDFYSDELNNVQLPKAVDDFGHVETTQVEVSGICHNCAKKPDNSEHNI